MTLDLEVHECVSIGISLMRQIKEVTESEQTEEARLFLGSLSTAFEKVSNLVQKVVDEDESVMDLG